MKQYLPATWCCEGMESGAELCPQHGEHCGDCLIVADAAGLPALPVRDGGTSFVPITFCPWCGAEVTPFGKVG